MRRLPAILAAVLAALALGACVPGEQTGPLLQTEDRNVTLDPRPGGAVRQPAMRPEIAPYASVLEVGAQTTDTGETVEVDREALGEDQAWVVILRDDEGHTGRRIGRVQVPSAAPVEDLTVELEEPLETGDHTLWARLLSNAAPLSQYEWPGPDEPAVNAFGDIVRTRFTVSVE